MLDIVTQTAKESARRAHAARPGAFAPSVHAKILRGKDERGLRMRHRFRALFAGWGLVLLCGGALWTKPRAITPRPKLVVLLVVDQMRADYVDHFHAQWSGGLERLVNQGAWFQHAVYPYLTTVTCAGHATISTGQLPDAHGIIANAWLDRASGKMVSCTADSNASDVSYGGEAHEGDSAWRLEAPSFAEELRAQGSGQTRVVSFSIKARAAIMLAGHKADAIAWHDDKTGLWVTSSAYHDAPFISAYTKTHPVAADYGKVWQPDPAEKFFYDVAPQKRQAPAGWKPSFPHELGGASNSTGPDAAFYTQWESSPFSAAYLLGLAGDAVDSLRLGQASSTDFLAISFSSLDLIGHAMGPYSHEVQDTLFQLDRDLGGFFGHLDQTVGAGNYVVAFSADHGVAPIPEEGAEQGPPGGRFSTKALTDRLEQILDNRWGGGKHVAGMVEGDLWFAKGEYDRLRADQAVLAEITKQIAETPGVARVFQSERLMRRVPARGRLEGAASFSYFASRSGDLVIALKPYWIYSEPSAGGTTHGSANEYDQHVPILFYGWGVRHGTFENPVSPADIAPTLAELCGFRMHHADGHSLEKLIANAKAQLATSDRQ